jgi:2-isopropylmalate synthase
MSASSTSLAAEPADLHDMLPSATATVSITENKGGKTRELVDAATGQGPVQAIFRCINRLVGIPETLLVDYEVKSVTEGTDALGQVVVRLRPGEMPLGDRKRLMDTEDEAVYKGVGTHWDILTASAKAYVSAVNRLLYAQTVATVPRKRIQVETSSDAATTV